MSVPTVTLAQKKKDDGCLKDAVCKDRYNKALKLYDEGRFAEALPEFQAAYARRQMPWLLLNIGRTMQRLGRAGDAISYYERYKKAEPNMEPEAEQRVNKYIEQARALTEPMPDQVDNKPKPATGEPVTPGVTPQNPPTGTNQAAVNLAPPPQPQPAPSQPESKPIYKKWWFWTIIGVVAAGAVTGGVLGARAASQSQAPPTLLTPNDPVYMPNF